MGSRSVNNVITPNSIALNAFIYGYGGHSLVTPHHAIQQVWWTRDRIEEKVTRDFVVSRLRPHQRDRLDDELSFGDGLTSDTYLDWILEKARRLFLILEEIGIPDQIFNVIDHSWDDGDLPLSLENVQQLSISYQIHEQLDRKFYDTQFKFLLRELHQGAHFDYGPGEIIPLEFIHKLPPAVTLQAWNRVHLPAQPDLVYVRRRIPLEHTTIEEVLADIETSRYVDHPHISPIWASYTSKNVAYFLTPFVSQHTLKSFIDHRSPPQYARLSKHDRGALLLSWLHCVASAVTALHTSGFLHTKIRPSNIVIDADNNVSFADIGALRAFQKDKKVDRSEAYNYSAPEAQAYSFPPSSNSDAASERAISISSKGSNDSGGSGKAKGKKLSSTFAFDFGFDGKTTTTSKKGVEPVESNDTEATDIYSLGCVFLDIITFMLRRKASDFVRHRSTKVKITKDKPSTSDKPKPKGTLTRLDGSFHNNPAKVESWMKQLEEQAFDLEDVVYRAIPPLLRLIRGMLAQDPFDRPAAFEVRDSVAQIIANYANIRDLHCPTTFSKPAQTQRMPGGHSQAQNLRSPVSPVSPQARPIDLHEESFLEVDLDSLADLTLRPYGLPSHGATTLTAYVNSPSPSPSDSSHQSSASNPRSPNSSLPPKSPLQNVSLGSPLGHESPIPRSTSVSPFSHPPYPPPSVPPPQRSRAMPSSTSQHPASPITASPTSPRSSATTYVPSARASSSTAYTHASSATAWSTTSPYSPTKPPEKGYAHSPALFSDEDDEFHFGVPHPTTSPTSPRNPHRRSRPTSPTSPTSPSSPSSPSSRHPNFSYSAQGNKYNQHQQHHSNNVSYTGAYTSYANAGHNTQSWDASSMTSSMLSPTAGIIREYAETIASRSSVSTDATITQRIMEERRARIEEGWKKERRDSADRKGGDKAGEEAAEVESPKSGKKAGSGKKGEKRDKEEKGEKGKGLGFRSTGKGQNVMFSFTGGMAV